MNLINDIPTTPVAVDGYHLIKPKVQRPAIAAVPLDAVIVPGPTVPLAFNEFLEWVVEKTTLHIAPASELTDIHIRGWEYNPHKDHPDRAPRVILRIGSNEGEERREVFTVGGLAWIDTDEFWGGGRRGFATSEIKDAARNMVEGIPDENARG